MIWLFNFYFFFYCSFYKLSISLHMLASPNHKKLCYNFLLMYFFSTKLNIWKSIGCKYSLYILASPNGLQQWNEEQKCYAQDLNF
jgi:hypothetical protein